MTAAPPDCGYAVILYLGKTGNLAAALSFRCLAAISFRTDKAFLTARPYFRKITVIFIQLEQKTHCRSLAVLTAPAHI